MHTIDRVSILLTGKPDRAALANILAIGLGVFLASWIVTGFGVTAAVSAALGALVGMVVVAVVFRLRRRREDGETDQRGT